MLKHCHWTDILLHFDWKQNFYCICSEKIGTRVFKITYPNVKTFSLKNVSNLHQFQPCTKIVNGIWLKQNIFFFFLKKKAKENDFYQKGAFGSLHDLEWSSIHSITFLRVIKNNFSYLTTLNENR